MAGTTIEDPDLVGECLKAALSADGVSWEHDAVNAVMGIPKPLAIASLLPDPEPSRVAEIHEDFRSRMIDLYETDPRVKPVPGVEAVFDWLRTRGVRVVLDTGFDRRIVDVILKRLQWDVVTVASDEVQRGRPHPDLIFRAMELTGVTDVTCVAKVGDTPSDLQEGTAAGCRWVIGVTEGTHRRDQLEVHPHTHLLGSVRELPAFMEREGVS